MSQEQYPVVSRKPPVVVAGTSSGVRIPAAQGKPSLARVYPATLRRKV